MARLHHPTILPVFDFLSVDNGHVLVLAFEGVFSLERVTSAMRRQPVRFEMQAALFVAHALFDALAHAHHKFHADGFPITHGDVHPSHLILCKDGHALVRGFCGVHPHGARDDVDPYAAPELEAGRPASPSSDLYGAAAIAWELLAGRGLPRNGPPPPVAAACPGAPAEVAAVLDTCLSADPALRCIRAGTVAATLRRAADLHEGQECLKRLHARVLRRLPASVRAVSSGTLPPRTPHDASSPTRRFLRHRCDVAAVPPIAMTS
jgi:serine/threonine protein kinase